jgi:hypothetical protein
MGHASPAWSSTTLSQTRSIVEHDLKPLLAEIRVGKLTTIDIDDMYRSLSRCGGRDGRPLTAGTVHRVHVVLHRALTQAVRWEHLWRALQTHWRDVDASWNVGTSGGYGLIVEPPL